MPPNDEKPTDCLIVIFGASGDLTKRKLIPALYYLWDTGRAPEKFAIVGISRSKYGDDEYRDLLHEFTPKSYPDRDKWTRFARHIHYQAADSTKPEGWPAIKKLEYVDLQMREICEERPVVSSREHVEPVRLIRKTLREHYQSKRERYGIGKETWFDRELYRLFAKNDNNRHLPLAATFLKEHRREFRQHVAEWTGQYHYTIDQVLQEMIDRCRELKLRVNKPAKDLTRDVQLMLTVQTMKLLRNSSHKVAL